MLADETTPQSVQAAIEHAEEAGLRYVYETDHGIARIKSCKGFTYKKDGKAFKDEKHLARIQKLAIPPAWRDVWICPTHNGHLQATGYDERGRKQYRYHADWRTRRDENKFTNMFNFGQQLPSIRRKILNCLNTDGLPKDKVIAAVIRLLDRTGLRIGNDSYMAENHTYGLTTIHKKHLDLHGKEIELDFPAKGGKIFKGTLVDAKVAKVISELEDLPGQRLFKYIDEQGELKTIGSSDINSWLHDNFEGNITAKDFRTWNACSLFLEESLKHCSEGSRFELKPVLKSVSKHLGNTPAILKKSYVHPELIDLYRTGCFLNKEWDHKNLKEAVNGLTKIENLLFSWLKKTYG